MRSCPSLPVRVHPSDRLEWWWRDGCLTVDHVGGGSSQLMKRQLPCRRRKERQMRSARMLMATAAASAVLALGAPVAYAVENDGDHTAPSYSKEPDKGQDT